MNERLNEELSKISFAEIALKNKSADCVTTDLNLYDGRNTALGYADVEWKSDKPEIVSPSGFVLCPKTACTVTLTAIFTYQDYPDLRGEVSINVTVLPDGGSNEERRVDSGKIRIFIAGDSTACDYPHEGENNRFPQTGWGQVFGELFNDEVIVVNCARSGRSSKSFLREENYSFICDNIQKGDYLFIQFAHNDCKAEDLQRYTSPNDNSYQECIYKFINTARNAGAFPVLCTSITRNLPSDTTLVPYGNALKKIGASDGIPVIDLYNRTNSLLKDGIQDFYMRLEPHDKRFINNPEFARSQYYENGSTDNTHLNINGARSIAKMVSDELRALKHSLAEYLN